MKITRRALVVGIDYYDKVSRLHGCVNDAYLMKSVLDRNYDGTKNFDVNLMISTDSSTTISRKQLKTQVEKLFADKADIALFYFSGHGHIENTGGYLITSDCSDGDDGFSMEDLHKFARQSKADNKIIILDCCHAGMMASNSTKDPSAFLAEGMTILTASSAQQYAMEANGSGVFTSLFVDAMTGSASDLVGNITPGSIYAHIDQSLGSWAQRPIFKTNVTGFTTLRKVAPPISLADLKEITTLFPIKEEFKLDPTYEPESEDPIPGNVKKFKLLQKYNRVNLVVPVNAEHMFFAAMESKSCKLTILGEHYWNLIKNERI